MLLISAVPEVYVATMNTFISDYYDYLEETLTHMKMIKLKSYLGENVTYLCTQILVDAEHLDSAGDFNPDYLGIITHIF